MDELLSANYIADLKSIGRKDKMLSIVGKAGDNIFVGGSAKRCETHFEVLCGLRRPDVGQVKLYGINPYELTAEEAATFRRDTIGAVPQDLGLIPELRMIDQIALPMKLAGVDDESIIAEIRKLTSETELVFLLNNMGVAEDVVSALQRKNIYANFDPNLTLAWELLQKQCWQTTLLSIGLLACAAALIREKRIAEIAKTRSEKEMLLLAGMTADAVDHIFPLRITCTCTACAPVAACISAIMGTFSLIAVGVSIIAVGIIEVAVLFFSGIE